MLENPVWPMCSEDLVFLDLGVCVWSGRSSTSVVASIFITRFSQFMVSYGFGLAIELGCTVLNYF